MNKFVLESIIDSTCGSDYRECGRCFLINAIDEPHVKDMISKEDDVTFIPIDIKDSDYPFGRVLVESVKEVSTEDDLMDIAKSLSAITNVEVETIPKGVEVFVLDWSPEAIREIKKYLNRFDNVKYNIYQDEIKLYLKS